MSNSPPATAASPAPPPGESQGHGRTNSTAREHPSAAPAPAPAPAPAGVKRSRTSIEVAAESPAPSRNGSQNSTPTPGQGPDVKKRKSAPGSRGVANLTPEQLAKKRANDREAQRAIRERTKLTIENLERRIRELTSQQPYQELQNALRAKEAVEAENADIKRRLASIVSMLQPIITQSANDHPVLPSPGQPFLPVSTAATPVPPSATVNNMSTPSSVASPPGTADPYTTQWNSAASTGSGHSAAQNQSYRAQLDQQRHELAHGLECGSERLGLEFLLGQSKGISRIHTALNGTTARESTGYRQPSHQASLSPQDFPQPSSNRLDSSTAARDNAIHSNIDPVLQGTIDPALSDHTTTPIKNCNPTCPLDNLLLDFLTERRQRAAEGFTTQEIIGPRYPSVSSLLNPLKESHPLSKVFIEILHTFPTISQLPERVAVLYVMFLLMRWQIQPSQDNYDRLPDFIRPQPAQIHDAHPAWIDHLPFPLMRERIIREFAPPDVFPFENFFVPFTTTLSLNWPYEDTDTLLQGSDGDELMINPVFERHLRRPENWTLGPAFARAFPALDGTYNLKNASVGAAPHHHSHHHAPPTPATAESSGSVSGGNVASGETTEGR